MLKVLEEAAFGLGVVVGLAVVGGLAVVEVLLEAALCPLPPVTLRVIMPPTITTTTAVIPLTMKKF
ncbi:MAG TPA: hypothetical protein VME20_09670 [Acidimicrobiales bacterium]|nr:hypothetical protein [Acidimicrobiales bacterium]